MVDDSKIRYLIKFVAQEKYANDLCDGNLFMHPAGYYHMLDKQGQGDIGEAALSSNTGIYRGCEIPIYCMTAVYSDNIKHDNILIKRRMIEDFNCKDGFAVLIEYKPFLSRLKTLEIDGKHVRNGLVQYCNIPLEQTKKWLLDISLDHLFIKRPFFSYQQEYRIVVLDKLQPKTTPKFYDGRYMNFLSYDVYCIYSINGGLSDISKIYEISSLRTEGDYAYIDVHEPS